MDRFFGGTIGKNKKEVTLEEKRDPQPEAIAEVFKMNPELALIGSQKEYIEYLKNIFPETVLKNILFHQGNDSVEKFNTTIKKPMSTDVEAIFFSPFNYKIPKVQTSLLVEVLRLQQPQQLWI